MPATGGFTGAGAQDALDNAFPSPLYLGLATVQVTATDTLSTITEVSTAGYARQAVTLGAATGTNPATRSNTNLITFDFDAGADPPSTQYGFLTDASTGTVGTIHYRFSGAAAVDGGVNEDYQVAIGGLVVNQATTEG